MRKHRNRHPSLETRTGPGGAIPCATPLLGSETKSHKATSKWLLMPPPPHCHPQLMGTRTMPTTDEPPQRATRRSLQHQQAGEANPSTSCACAQLPLLFPLVVFLPPCSRFPNFAAKMQRRRKPSLLQHCRAPTDLPWGRSRRAIPQGSPQTR